MKPSRDYIKRTVADCAAARGVAVTAGRVRFNGAPYSVALCGLMVIGVRSGARERLLAAQEPYVQSYIDGRKRERAIDLVSLRRFVATNDCEMLLRGYPIDSMLLRRALWGLGPVGSARLALVPAVGGSMGDGAAFIFMTKSAFVIIAGLDPRKCLPAQAYSEGRAA